ncbi:MAG: UDP-N-acetylmuramoyl-tripeptide--D-alanyl-D-alanine ligase [Chitinispirillales bacterium]|jgi:UDP-N-acetylmuramoyl-tripeptide--D-alanyl-D-alanine ligase|nr:UDP-N-acetylmuramoyl-tripeptide--D-alanyl-D-alanine ligase [Chitinispirillales bacterium]
MQHNHNNNKTKLTLGSLIDWSSGKSDLSESARKRKVAVVWNDSRKVTPGGGGDVFVALRGDADDGHRYVESAFKSGAVAAIVDKKGICAVPEKYRKKCIIVGDTLKSIQKAAARYRREMGLLVVGVTGSNGKTTTRSFISAALKSVVKTGETYTNWNNHIGVPQSVLRFDGDEFAGVLEMGANHTGEIRRLTKICGPDIAVITNIGYAHVGLFGSLDKTVEAKFEIAEGLSRGGFMLLNGDDNRLVKGAQKRGLKSVFFGTSPKCGVRARNIVVDESGVRFTVDGRGYGMSMPGRHFIYCALPAIHIAKRCGLADEAIQEAIASLKPVALRGKLEVKRGIRFIVDCYNANPSSMSGAVRYLADVTPNANGRVAVIGDMGELGRYTNRLHIKLGEELVKKGDVQKIVAVGNFSESVKAGAVKAGMSARKIFLADSADAAIDVCRYVLKRGETVLLKGSRNVGLEKVFESL